MIYFCQISGKPGHEDCGQVGTRRRQACLQGDEAQDQGQPVKKNNFRITKTSGKISFISYQSLIDMI